MRQKEHTSVRGRWRNNKQGRCNQQHVLRDNLLRNHAA
jgi:hypothetical protein